MSTSYGFACPEHDAATSFHAAQQRLGQASLVAMWRARAALAELGSPAVAGAVLEGPRFYAVDERQVERFLAEHRDCQLEIVSEYGDRRLLTDVADELTEPDADEIVRRVLVLLQFPEDAVERTHRAIVDALWAQRVISYHRKPERLR